CHLHSPTVPVNALACTEVAFDTSSLLSVRLSAVAYFISAWMLKSPFNEFNILILTNHQLSNMFQTPTLLSHRIKLFSIILIHR
ncbi:hypothetical protein R0K17_19195, partial [Planococcus sp. SIMBA_143]